MRNEALYLKARENQTVITYWCNEPVECWRSCTVSRCPPFAAIKLFNEILSLLSFVTLFKVDIGQFQDVQLL